MPAPDLSALRRLFEAHYPALCRQALRHTGDAALAEGLVQDLFVEHWTAGPATPPALAEALAQRLPPEPHPVLDSAGLPALSPRAEQLLQQLLGQGLPPEAWPAQTGLDRATLLQQLAEILTGSTTVASRRIAAYLTGLASPEEEHALRHWVDAEPAHSQQFEAAYEVWDALRQHPGWYQPDLEAGWDQVRGRIAALPTPPPAPTRRAWWPGLFLLLLLLGAGLWWGWPAPTPRYGAYTGPWPGGGQAYTRPGDSLAATFDRQGSLWVQGTVVLDLRQAGRQRLPLRAPARDLRVADALLSLHQQGAAWEIALLEGQAELRVGAERLLLSPGTRAFFTPAAGVVQKGLLPPGYCAGLTWVDLACE